MYQFILIENHTFVGKTYKKQAAFSHCFQPTKMLPAALADIVDATICADHHRVPQNEIKKKKWRKRKNEQNCTKIVCVFVSAATINGNSVCNIGKWDQYDQYRVQIRSVVVVVIRSVAHSPQIHQFQTNHESKNPHTQHVGYLWIYCKIYRQDERARPYSN